MPFRMFSDVPGLSPARLIVSPSSICDDQNSSPNTADDICSHTLRKHRCPHRLLSRLFRLERVLVGRGRGEICWACFQAYLALRIPCTLVSRALHTFLQLSRAACALLAL